ncbi:sugar kinase [Paenibacillus sp. N1-5-1-14]|uniref:sugar kinase n=1 Tax=Paenibacillus radicibacter TaxID=2972488 RepID=UPI002159B150|nr:sugar kinase [Paenibacillus radicibacter]MCR8644809.1 sugar kinase [Paenibacillus radicibacter]
MHQLLEVITFGETMGLMMPTSSKGIEYTSTMECSFGGAESNVAIGLSRLGHRVGWFSKLGEDPIGTKIVKTIRGEGVDVSRVQFSTTVPTGLIIREVVAGKSSVYYYRAHSAASRMTEAILDESYIASCKILHITGITPALSEPCCELVYEAVRLAKKHGVRVSFDPNLRLKLWSVEQARKMLLPLAAQADYFLPGMDELKLLYDTEDEGVIFDKLHELGNVSVVKGGDNVTYLVEQGAVRAVPYIHVEHVIDTVGAGDAFCAGFLSGLLKGESLEEAVRLGNLLGSMVIQVEGDWQGLPTWKQVQAKLNLAVHVER